MLSNMELSVATFNLRNTTDRYDERKQLLLDTLAAVDFHICGLQEVRFEPSACHGLMDQVEELISAHPSHLSAYRAPLHTPYLSADDKFRIDGNCILVNTDKVDVISHSTLELSIARTAHRIVFQRRAEGRQTCSYTNVHLHHQLEAVDETIRLEQAERTLAWMDALDKDQQVSISFLGGDFNAPPHEKAYSCILRSQFRSLYSQFHGTEPAQTFPTGLKADTMDVDPPLTVDYIFYKLGQDVLGGVELDGGLQGLITHDVRIFGDKHKHNDTTIYPSDHVGVFARVSIP